MRTSLGMLQRIYMITMAVRVMAESDLFLKKIKLGDTHETVEKL